MRRFLNKLLRDFKTTGTARGGRGAPRRATLQVEGLEDRLVLSTAKLVGTTLEVVASPGTFSHGPPGGPIVVAHIRQITIEADKAHAGKLDVLDNGALLGRFSIASIKAATVQVAGLDNVTVDDSNGLPFATNVNMTLFGTGAVNSLNVTGFRPFTPGADEGYTAGNGATDGELDTLNGNAFKFSNAIGTVTDSIPSGGILTDAFGANVTLSNSSNGMQTVRGMSLGGAGDTFSYSNKKFVGLGIDNASGSATLNATAAAAGEQTFSVALRGQFASADIKATPSTVETDVLAGGVSLSNPSRVVLEGNSGFVKISGGSATTVTVGQTVSPGELVTSGIQANVSVTGVGFLLVDDSGNTKTAENVKVTESTISGTGLFGNFLVTLTYTNPPGATLDLVTGQLADTYTIVGSKSGAHFASDIEIDSESKKALSVTATVDAGSGLNMQLTNVHVGQPVVPASLTIIALGGTFSRVPPSVPIGIEDVTFPGGQLSEIGYDGFQTVTLISGIPHATRVTHS